MTMTKLEYEAKIRDLERQLIELKQAKVDDENDPQPPHPRPKLNCGEKYYYNEHDGETFGYFWNYTDWDYGNLAIGNVFMTENAAVFAAERLKVIAQMREWAGKWNDPWIIIYDSFKVEAIPVYGKDVTFGELRFASEKDAEGCIKAVGEDRLKKYYFGIPEDDGCCTSER